MEVVPNSSDRYTFNLNNNVNVSVNLTLNGKTKAEDPKHMDIRQIIQVMDPRYVAYCLDTVLKFLKSGDTDFIFTPLDAYTETFFVRIVKNNNNLTCPAFNNTCKNIAREILQCLEENRSSFRWLHGFEFGMANEKLLYYTKKAVKNNLADRLNRHRIENTQPPETTQNGKPKNQESVENGFKIHWLNATLKFIKDDTQTLFNYPEMSVEQAEFVYNLINNPKYDNVNVGFGFKSLYAPLWEAMKIFELKYKFNVSFVATSKDDTTSLVLEKVPKTTKNKTDDERNNNHCNLNASITSDTTQNSEGDLTNDKKMMRYRNIICFLPHAYVKETLQTISIFVQDELRSTLVFEKVESDEAKFLSLISVMSRKKRGHSLLRDDCREFMKGIFRGCKNVQWKLEVIQGKDDPVTKTKSVTFTKTPCFDPVPQKLLFEYIEQMNLNPEEIFRTKIRPDKCDTQDIIQKSCDITQKHTKFIVTLRDPSESVSSVSQDANKENNSLILSVKNDISTDKSRDMSTDKSRDISSDKSRSVSQGRDASVSSGNRIKNPISFQVGEDLDSTKEKPSSIAEVLSITGKGTGRMKAKLIEGLSAPLESDKAMRMMRAMGWDGGALGLRGEGIMEPIMPALDLKAGAGLGHVPPPKKQKAPIDPNATSNTPSAIFRKTVLSTILGMVKNNQMEEDVFFTKTLKKKDKSFLKHAVNSLCSRLLISLSMPDEVALVHELHALFRKDPRLMVDASISNGLKTVTLKVTRGDEIQQSGPKIPTEFLSDDNIHDIIKQTKTQIKCKESHMFRTVMLMKISEFVNSGLLVKEICFEKVLKPKYVNFIEASIKEINRRTVGGANKLENSIFKQILFRMAECTINVKFNTTMQRVTLRKVIPITSMEIDIPGFNNKNEELYEQMMSVKKEILKEKVDIKNECIDLTQDSDDDTNNLKVDLITNDGMNKLTINDSARTDFSVKLSSTVEKVDNMDMVGVVTTFNDKTNDINDLNKDFNDITSNESLGSDNINKKLVEIQTLDGLAIKNFVEEIQHIEANFNDINDFNEKITNIQGANKDLDIAVDMSSNENDYIDLTTEDLDTKLQTPNVSTNLIGKIRVKDEFKMVIGNSIVNRDLNPDISNVLKEETTNLGKDSQIGESNVKCEIKENLIENSEKIDQNDSDIEVLIDLQSISDSSDIDSLSSDIKELEKDLLEMNKNDENSIQTTSNLDLNEEESLLLNGLTECTSTDISPSAKRSRSNSNDSQMMIIKKTKYLSLSKQYVFITPIDYPKSVISKESVKEIQSLISNYIDQTRILPLLSCHGIKDGGLVYGCHNDMTLSWMQELVSVASNLKITDLEDFTEENFHKVSIKINSFLDYEANTLFKKLELYNTNLKVDSWSLIGVEKSDDFVLFSVKIDDTSFKVITDNNFTLYAGVDKAQFSILWD